MSGEAEQTFTIACPHCNAGLRCALKTVPDEGRIAGLILDGQPARLRAEAEGTPVVNVSTDLFASAMPQSLADPYGSGFIMHHARLGDDLSIHTHARLGRFDQLIDANWMDIVRWWGYYAEGRRELFDGHSRSYWDDEWPEDSPALYRHDAIHRALEAALLHVYGAEYVQMNELARRRFPGAQPDEVSSLSKTLANSGRLASARTELFDVIDEFIQKRSEWRPGAHALTYDLAGIERDRSWRIQREDFTSLRALYLACFERSFRNVDLAMMLCDLIDRGDASLYPDGEHRSMATVRRLTAADKEDIVSLYDWGQIFLNLFDR